MSATDGNRRVRGFTLEQPAALRTTLRALADARVEHLAGPCREIVLVGSGTSKNALIATAPSFRRAHGCPVTVMGPLEFMRSNPPGAGTLVVVVSQTGISTTSVAALEAAQARRLRTIAVTAEAASPFGQRALERWLLAIGPEDIGPKTKGYTATLAALLALVSVTAPLPTIGARPDADAFADWFAATLPGWEATGRGWAERFADADHLMLVGAERHVGTALEAALKLQEMAGLPASAFDLEEALHGRFHGLGPRGAAIFVVGDARDERAALGAAAALAGLGVPAVVATTSLDAGTGAVGVGRFPDAIPAYDVLGAVVPFQFFAEFAAHARGVDPDAMRYPDMSARLGIKLPVG